MENLNDEQLELLAFKIVDCWDLETLMSYAQENLFIYYKNNPTEAISQMEELEWELSDLESCEF